MLKAGYAKICITPRAGAPLTGYAARKEVSRGVHDDLFVRAVVLENDGAAAALVSVEVLAIGADLAQRMRREAGRKTGIPPDAILVAATHTHSGPVTAVTFFNPDERLDAEYVERLVEAVRESVETAWRKRFPARIGFGSGREKLGANRRDPEHGPVDEEVGVIRIDDAAGRTRILAINYACHPTVLGSDNLLVSGDFPAAALAEVEARLGADSLALFFNGAEANVSVGHSSTLTAIGVITPGRTFERAGQLGARLAGAALAAAEGASMDDRAALSCAVVETHLPYKDYPPVAETEAALRQAERRAEEWREAGLESEEYRKAKLDLLYASVTHANAGSKERSGTPGVVVEVQAVRVGRAWLFGFPGELFVEIGKRIKSAAPGQAFVIGLANGYVGYVPTRRAFGEDGYEVVSASCGPEAEETVVKAVAELVERLR